MCISDFESEDIQKYAKVYLESKEWKVDFWFNTFLIT